MRPVGGLPGGQVTLPSVGGHLREGKGWMGAARMVVSTEADADHATLYMSEEEFGTLVFPMERPARMVGSGKWLLGGHRSMSQEIG